MKIDYNYYNKTIGIIRDFCKLYKDELIDSQVKLLVEMKEYCPIDIDVEGYRRYMTEASLDLFTGNMLGTMLYQDEAIAIIEDILDGNDSLSNYINEKGILEF